jgi:hypothetical protein
MSKTKKTWRVESIIIGNRPLNEIAAELETKLNHLTRNGYNTQMPSGSEHGGYLLFGYRPQLATNIVDLLSGSRQKHAEESRSLGPDTLEFVNYVLEELKDADAQDRPRKIQEIVGVAKKKASLEERRGLIEDMKTIIDRHARHADPGDCPVTRDLAAVREALQADLQLSVC